MGNFAFDEFFGNFQHSTPKKQPVHPRIMFHNEWPLMVRLRFMADYREVETRLIIQP